MCNSVTEVAGVSNDAFAILVAAGWPDELIDEAKDLLNHTREKILDGQLDPCEHSDSIASLQLKVKSFPEHIRKIIEAILELAERISRLDPPMRLRFDTLPVGRGKMKRKVGLLILFRPNRPCGMAPEECRVYRYVFVPLD